MNKKIILMLMSVLMLISASSSTYAMKRNNPVKWGTVDRPEPKITKLLDRSSLKKIDYSELKHVRCLGTGGNGVVALMEYQGKNVAVKHIKGTVLTCGEKLLEEGVRGHDLEGTNVIKTIGYCDSPVGIVLEYCPGGSFNDYCKTGSKKTTSIFSAIYGSALSIKTIHDKNCAHLDVKPSNFLFAKDPREIITYSDVRLIDFGGSGAAQGNGLSVYTLEYLSPERASARVKYWNGIAGTIINQKPSDIYALGLMYCEFFISNHTSEKMRKVFDKKLTPEERNKARNYFLEEIISGEFKPNVDNIIQHIPKKGKELAELIKSMLANNPEDRPTIDQVIEKLCPIYEENIKFDQEQISKLYEPMTPFSEWSQDHDHKSY